MDACRNNPFKGIFKGEVTDGLAPVSMSKVPSGSLIAYAADEGQLSAVGTGRNSPYVTALKQELKKSNLTVFQIFTRVRQLVKENIRDLSSR